VSLDEVTHLIGGPGGTLIAGLVILVAVAITSLRKRRDITIEELEKRVEDRKAEIGELQGEIVTLKARMETMEHESEQAVIAAEQRAEGYKALMLANSRSLFEVRSLLAEHGIADPTA
jgi:chromosome segregation ATPase